MDFAPEYDATRDEMIIRDLISEGVLPVSRDDSVGDALSQAVYGEMKHLPVVDETRRLIGMVRLSTLLEQEDVSKRVGELPFDAPFSVSEDGHLYDAIQLVVEHGADLLPVVSAEGLYVGSIGLANVLGPVSRLLATPHRGAILEIEAPDPEFVLRHLIHAIEETGARVLSLGTNPPGEKGDPFVIVLKLSVEDTSRVRAVLEHTGFHVRRGTGHEMGDQELRQRVAEFMHYLDV